MSQFNTSHRYIFDAAPATLFRGRSEAAVTGPGPLGPVKLDALDGYWNTNGELADQTLAVILNVVDIDTTDGDEAYPFIVAASDGDDVMLTGNEFGTIEVTEIGQYVLPLDIPTALQLDPTTAGLMLFAGPSGTTPSITFHAWVGMVKK